RRGRGAERPGTLGQRGRGTELGGFRSHMDPQAVQEATAPAMAGGDADPLARALAARAAGATVRAAASAAGVHVATLCRWLAASAGAGAASDRGPAAGLGRGRLAALPRPRVATHLECPGCGGPVEVRGAFGPMLRFWRCGRRPACGWASWRPRCPWDC